MFSFNDFYFDCNLAEVINNNSHLKISLFIKKAILSLIKKIFVRTTFDNEERLFEMKSDESHNNLLFIKFDSLLPYNNQNKLNIRFKILTNEKIFWINSRHIYEYNPNDYFDYKIIFKNEIPNWVNKTIFYQIFPDRFWHGIDEKNYTTEKLNELFKKLYGKRKIYFKNTQPKVKLWNEPVDPSSLGYEFYMGNLNGIIKKIDYLKELGINAIYLTPIFKSPTNHRYDTIDYFKVDPLLGGNIIFKKFMKYMHKNDIKVIIDAVFNHSGFSCNWFLKAQKGIKPYVNFYNFYDKKRTKYVSWLGHGNLPKLNYSCKKLRSLIYKSKNSVAYKWFSSPYNIDGLRLDAAQMIGCNGTAQNNIEILQDMKKYFKKFNKNSFILAENFFDSYDMTNNNCIDSVMNYHGFTFPVINFLAKKEHNGNYNNMNIKNFCDWILDCYAKTPQIYANVMYNMLSSHDIPRYASILNQNEKLILPALIFLFTFPGIPSIFYGDEFMLTGEKDPYCRMPMIWNENLKNTNIFNLYKLLIKIRKSYNALAYGSFRIINVSNNSFCYIRKYFNEIIFVLINFSNQNLSLNFLLEDIFIFKKIKKYEKIFDSTLFQNLNENNFNKNIINEKIEDINLKITNNKIKTYLKPNQILIYFLEDEYIK